MTQLSLPELSGGCLRQGSSLLLKAPAGIPRYRCQPQQRRQHTCRVRAQAKEKKTSADPPDIPKEENRRGGREWLQQLLSKFGPISEKAENTHVLDFEKPLVELDNRIKEVLTSHRLWRAVQTPHHRVCIT